MQQYNVTRLDRLACSRLPLLQLFGLNSDASLLAGHIYDYPRSDQTVRR